MRPQLFELDYEVANPLRALPGLTCEGRSGRWVGCYTDGFGVAAEYMRSASSAIFYSGSTVAKAAAVLDEELRDTLTVVTPAPPIVNELSTVQAASAVPPQQAHLPCHRKPQSDTGIRWQIPVRSAGDDNIRGDLTPSNTVRANASWTC